VFKRYGTGYVLKDVFLAGSSNGAETIPAEGERHAAKHGGPQQEERVTAKKTAATAKNQ
jgi:hypothetical protein